MWHVRIEAFNAVGLHALPSNDRQFSNSYEMFQTLPPSGTEVARLKGNLNEPPWSRNLSSSVNETSQGRGGEYGSFYINLSQVEIFSNPTHCRFSESLCSVRTEPSPHNVGRFGGAHRLDLANEKKESCSGFISPYIYHMICHVGGFGS